VIPACRPATTISLRLASSTKFLEASMLEWKPRLLILLAFAAAVAVVLGDFGWLNYGW